MGRQTKPYYRKAQKRWVCTIDGSRVTLGANKQAAFEKFHQLMLEKDNLAAQLSTLYDLSQVYLDWCHENRKPGTYDKHLVYLKSFIEHIGKSLKIAALKPHHLTNWVQAHPTWNSTTRNDAIGIVQRMLNWAAEEGHIARTPIPKVKKPRRLRREIFYTDEQWERICSHVNDEFIDLLEFMWETGARPKEARMMEAQHVHLDFDLCMYSSQEAKGEDVERVIFLTDRAKEILSAKIELRPSGTLFRNRIGNAWTKDSIKCRLQRIAVKVGFRVIAYGVRHSYATHGLMGGTDSVVLSQLMGHKDNSTLARVYQKLSQNPDFLREQARRVRSA